MINDTNFVWVFSGEGARFPGGVFRSRTEAEQLISESKLTGMLTKYPLDCFVIDWAVNNDLFALEDANDVHTKRQTFSSAHLEHYHYEDGQND